MEKQDLVQENIDNTVFEGKIFDVIQTEVEDGRTFERVRRAPGVRLIITKDDKIILTKEFRRELNDYDFRLPGGKVFDRREDFKSALDNKEDILNHAEKAAEKECLEETGHFAKKVTLIQKSIAGATVEWDLYYFHVEESEESPTGQELEHGEDIEVMEFTKEEAIKLCLNNEVKEDRSLGILLRFLMKWN